MYSYLKTGIVRTMVFDLILSRHSFERYPFLFQFEFEYFDLHISYLFIHSLMQLWALLDHIWTCYHLINHFFTSLFQFHSLLL